MNTPQTEEFSSFVVAMARETHKIDAIIEDITITNNSVVSIALRTKVDDVRVRWEPILTNFYKPTLTNTGDAKKWLVDIKNEIINWRSSAMADFAQSFGVLTSNSRNASVKIKDAIREARSTTDPVLLSAADAMQEMYNTWVKLFPEALREYGSNSLGVVADRCLDVFTRYKRDQYMIAPYARVSFGVGTTINVADVHITTLCANAPVYDTIHNRSLVVIGSARPAAYKAWNVMNDDERTTKLGVVFDAVTSVAPGDIDLATFVTGGFSMVGNFMAPLRYLMISYNDVNARGVPVDLGFTLKLVKITGYPNAPVRSDVAGSSTTKITGVNSEITIHIPGDANDNVAYALVATAITTPVAATLGMIGVEIKHLTFSTPNAGSALLLGNTNALNAEKYFSQYIGLCTYPQIEKVLAPSINDAFMLARQYHAYCVYSGTRKTLIDGIGPDYNKIVGFVPAVGAAIQTNLDSRILSISWWLAPTSDMNFIQKSGLYSKFWSRFVDFVRLAAVDGGFHSWLQDNL